MRASKQNASAEAMARQARESQMAAAEGYRNRMLALDKSANLGGDIRDSEMSEEARNVGILNSFNERTSRNYQDYLQQRADSLNRAKIMELERARTVADTNVQARNRAQEQSRDLFNEQQKINYGVKKDNRANTLEMIDRQNRLKQQMYGNLMDKARGKAGIAQTSIDYMNKAAQDQNQAVRGVGDAATAGAMYYGKYGGDQPKPTAPGGDDYAGGMVQPGEDDRYAYPF